MPVYVLTGANRGLGLEFVRQLAKSNDNTIIACTRSMSSDLSDLKSVASSSTHILECNTGDLKSIETFASELKKALGGKKVDYLLNNAGINKQSDNTSLTFDPKDLHYEMDINVIGPAKVTENLLEHDLLASNARLMNMTTGLASMGISLTMNPRKCATYSISKAALNMLTVHQSLDIKKKLSDAVVIVMDPGWVKTRMGGEGAILEPEESIGGMLKTIHGLKAEDNGKFFVYDGSEKAW